MPNQGDSWPAARIVYLVGGCQAINPPGPTVEIWPKSLSGNVLKIELPKYSSLFNELYSKFETIELPIIGVDFFADALPLEGSVPPDWRPFHNSGDSAWYCWDMAQYWAEISHGAYRKKNGKLWDLSSRIKHQLRVCSWRLRQISQSYSDELKASLLNNNKNFEVGKLFEDGFTWLAYLAIQAFLVDACVLRDYLAEFAGEYVLKPVLKMDIKISSMGKLKKEVLDKCETSDPIFYLLKSCVQEGGWIKNLGDYRNLVVHSAPLARAENHQFAVFRSLRFNEAEAIPAIACPIPDNPAKICSARAKEVHFEDFENLIAAFWEAARGTMPSKDGLEYAHWVTGCLCELSNLLAQRSPIPPEKMIFDKSNIIGPITTRIL